MPPTRLATSVAISKRTWLRTSRRGVCDMAKVCVFVCVNCKRLQQAERVWEREKQ